MNETQRLTIIVILFVVMGTVVWFALFGSETPEDTAHFPLSSTPVNEPDPEVATESEATPEPSPDGRSEVAPLDSGDAPDLSGSVIMGRVYDIDTLAGVDGVEMLIRDAQPTREDGVKTVTDSEGHYSFTGLGEGAYRINRLSTDEYIDEWSTRLESVRRVAAVGFESVTGGIDFALKRGLTLSGVVVDSEGMGIGDVELSAQSDENSDETKAQSGEDGTFQLVGLFPDDRYRLYANKKGFGVSIIRFNTASETERSVYRVTLLPEARIEGIVVDQEGNPLAKYRVRASPDDSQSVFRGSAKTDDEGTFAMDRLIAGIYTVTIRAKSSESYLAEPTETVRLEQGQIVSGLRLVHDTDAGPFIEGFVTNSRGQPLDEARVWVEQGVLELHASTDSEGFYRIAGLKEGWCNVVVSREGYSYQRRSVPPNSSGVNFVLLGKVTVEGQVVRARTGEPIPVFEIGHESGTARTYPFSRFSFNVVNESEGRFTLDDIDQGDVTLAVRAQGHTPKQVPIYGLLDNRTRSGIRIVLDPGTILRGSVRGAEGETLASASVTIHRANEHEREEVYTDVDGNYLFDSLFPGPITVTAHHKGYGPKAIPFELHPRQNRLDITLGNGATVRGRVRIGNEAARGFAVGVNYDLRYGSGFSASTRTDDEGRYEITNLPSGEAEITAYHTIPHSLTELTRWESITLPENGTRTVDLEFLPLNASIEGYIYGDADTPVAAGVRVRNEGDGANYTRDVDADRNGYYRLDGLAPGPSILSAYRQGFPSRRVRVQLTSGETTHRDVHLDGGGSARVTVVNVPPETGRMLVTLFRGGFEIPLPSNVYLQPFQRHRVTRKEVQGGSVALPGLEPGIYTILLEAHVDYQSLGDRDFYEAMSTATEIITIETEGQLVEVEMSF